MADPRHPDDSPPLDFDLNLDEIIVEQPESLPGGESDGSEAESPAITALDDALAELDGTDGTENPEGSEALEELEELEEFEELDDSGHLEETTEAEEDNEASPESPPEIPEGESAPDDEEGEEESATADFLEDTVEVVFDDDEEESYLDETPGSDGEPELPESIDEEGDLPKDEESTHSRETEREDTNPPDTDEDETESIPPEEAAIPSPEGRGENDLPADAISEDTSEAGSDDLEELVDEDSNRAPDPLPLEEELPGELPELGDPNSPDEADSVEPVEVAEELDEMLPELEELEDLDQLEEIEPIESRLTPLPLAKPKKSSPASLDSADDEATESPSSPGPPDTAPLQQSSQKAESLAAIDDFGEIDDLDGLDYEVEELAPADSRKETAPSRPQETSLENEGVPDEITSPGSAAAGSAAKQAAKKLVPLEWVSLGAVVLVILVGLFAFQRAFMRMGGGAHNDAPLQKVPEQLDGTLFQLEGIQAHWRDRRDGDRVDRDSVILPEVSLRVTSESSGYLQALFRDETGELRGDSVTRSLTKGKFESGNPEAQFLGTEGFSNEALFAGYRAAGEAVAWSVTLRESSDNTEWTELATFRIPPVRDTP